MRQDTVIAVLGFIGGTLMLATNLVISHTLAKTVPPAIILACGLYLLARWRADGEQPGTSWLGYPQVGLFIVLSGSALLIFISTLTEGRSVPFYLLASLLGTFILLQLFFTPDRFLHPGAMLVEILLFIGVLRFPALYAVPGFTGIDIWIHVPNLTERLVETGSIDGMGDSKYVGSPLYHLLIAVASMFADVPLREGLYLSLGTTLVVSSLLVFATMRYLVPTRWALFAMALYGMTDYFIRWSIHLIPTSMSTAMFLGIVFLLVRRLEGLATLRDDVMLLILFVAVALTHQLSSVIVLTVLGAALLAHGLYTSRLFPLTRAMNHESPPVGVTTATAGVATATLLSYVVFKVGLLSFVWSQTPYYGQTLLDGAVTTVQQDIATLTEGGGNTDISDAVDGPDGLPYQSFINYLDRVGFILLLFGTTVGTAVSMQARRLTQTTSVLVVCTAVLATITLIPPVLGINSLIPGRWYPFLYVGMAMLSALGFGYLRQDLVVPVFVVCAVLFALVYPGAMILSTAATPDAPAFGEHNVKYSYTESELAAAETLIDRTTRDEGGAIFSDHPYVLTLNRLDAVRFGVATVDEDGTLANDRVIYRSYHSSGAPVFDLGGEQHVQQLSEDDVCDPTRDRPYTSGNVHLCTA